MTRTDGQHAGNQAFVRVLASGDANASFECLAPAIATSRASDEARDTCAANVTRQEAQPTRAAPQHQADAGAAGGATAAAGVRSWRAF
jgi:hypothetical protein